MRDSLMDGKTLFKKSVISLVPLLGVPSCPAKKHQSLDQTTQYNVPEFHSLDRSFRAYSDKIYYSGQLTIQIAKTIDGQRVFNQDWNTVWAQLRGTLLTIWDLEEIEKTAKYGMEVLPNYICIDDAVRLSKFVLTP
jgi:hypothetical protein